MKVRALRGVCIGIGRHLITGQSQDMDAAMVTFLVGIGAVERISDEVVEEAKSDESSMRGKPGKKEKPI